MQACQDPYAVIARPKANHQAVRLPADPQRKLLMMPRRTPAVVEQLGIQPAAPAHLLGLQTPKHPDPSPDTPKKAAQTLQMFILEF